ncbi:MAG: NAD(P)H-hydrate dehydratase [Saprospiraceae bacterium]|nr:NAD(P)H-hydrate dehydratase [Saprospiraceae bacterium]
MEGLKKIIDVQQTRDADQFTIIDEPISSIELMERASKAFVEAIEKHLDTNQSIAVVCGSGNNGGDGLAVARILSWKGYDVYPFLFKIGSQLSQDCKINSQKIDSIITIEKESENIDFQSFDIIIDGLFGSGLSRPIEGWVGHVVDLINASGARVFSIDIPSGMSCDRLLEGNHIIKSDLVVSFQRPKLSFFQPESSPYIKLWEVVDIGLSESYIQSLPSEHFVIDRTVSNLLLDRPRYSHKGNYGHALIIAGAKGKMGAAILCAGGCLRSGVGLLTMHIPACGLDVMQGARPEAMCTVDPHAYHFSTAPDVSKYTCIGVGPGIGLSLETKAALVHLMNTAEIPMVLDADALNIISSDHTLLALIPEHSILTPHPKEFERLTGAWKSSLERLEKQKQFSKMHRCIVVLKDADTVVTDALGNAYFNTTGNSGMATGGSGDVLTGIVTGLMAQGYNSLLAALLGVYFHGKAGDSVADLKGKNACIASDLVDHLRIEKIN